MANAEGNSMTEEQFKYELTQLMCKHGYDRVSAPDPRTLLSALECSAWVSIRKWCCLKHAMANLSAMSPLAFVAELMKQADAFSSFHDKATPCEHWILDTAAKIEAKGAGVHTAFNMALDIANSLVSAGHDKNNLPHSEVVTLDDDVNDNLPKNQEGHTLQ